jgi:hypothetical protein
MIPAPGKQTSWTARWAEDWKRNRILELPRCCTPSPSSNPSGRLVLVRDHHDFDTHGSKRNRPRFVRVHCRARRTSGNGSLRTLGHRAISDVAAVKLANDRVPGRTSDVVLNAESLPNASARMNAAAPLHRRMPGRVFRMSGSSSRLLGRR